MTSGAAWRQRFRRSAMVVASLVLAAACTDAPPRDAGAPSASPAALPTARAEAPSPRPPGVVIKRSPRPAPPKRSPRAPKPARRPTTDATAPPAWIGTRVLPRRSDGWGERQPTPPRLRNRRFLTTDLLPPPPSNRFTWQITAVPKEVVARSTWTKKCPLSLEQLRYATVSFWGFDDRPHTGEMIVNAAAAEDLVDVFRRLYGARFPIEEMRVRRAGEIDAPPTGDYNNTDVFDCRPATGGSHWSQHAYGLAIDINPFHNPYLKGDLVVPELAEAYLDRSWHRPGMIQPGDVVTEAFADIGWGWGGSWSSLKDWQHFSSNGH